MKSILVMGGAKGETKIPLIEKLSSQFDQVLIGGRMPIEIQNAKFKMQNYNAKFKIANLKADKLDITEESASEFAEIIKNASMVVWNGPMGAYERAKFQITNDKLQIDSKVETEIKNTAAYGTYLVAKAMNETKAFTVTGGGDTEAALTKFNLEKGIDWVSSGGGAMLTYLAKRKVAFLEAGGDK